MAMLRTFWIEQERGSEPPARHLLLAFGHNALNPGCFGAEPPKHPAVACSFNY